jgi:hypothetical protein
MTRWTAKEPHEGSRRRFANVTLCAVFVAGFLVGCGNGDHQQSSRSPANGPPQGFQGNHARNAPPGVPTEDNVGIAETWNVPAGTHVTVTFMGSGSAHCTKNEKNPSFDTGPPPYRRTDLLYTRSIDGVCSVQLSSAVFLIKTSTGQTREINVVQQNLRTPSLYYTQCRAGTLPCRDSGGGMRATNPPITFG